MIISGKKLGRKSSFKVMIPLLSNPANHDDWPALISEEIQDSLEDLRAAVFMAQGESLLAGWVCAQGSGSEHFLFVVSGLKCAFQA